MQALWQIGASITLSPTFMSFNKKPTYVLFESPFSSAETGEMIGRFVANPGRPLDDFVPKDIEKLSTILHSLPSPPLEGPIEDVITQLSSLTNANAIAKVQGIFGISGDVSRSRNRNLSAKKVIIRKAQQHFDLFDALMADKDIKASVMSMLAKLGAAYMVVSTKSVFEAEMTVEDVTAHAVTAQANCPIPMDPTGMAMSVAIGAGVESGRTWFEKYAAKEEKLYAIEYRKIKQKRGPLGLLRRNDAALSQRVYEVGRAEGVYYHDHDEDVVLEGDEEEEDGAKNLFDCQVELCLVDISEADIGDESVFEY